MLGPKTYSEWVNLLDKFINGDDLALEILERGVFNIDAGTAHRFYVKVEEVYKKRKLKWLESFQKIFEYSGLKKVDDFEIALRNAKQNLTPLLKFINLPAFPKDLSDVLKKDLQEFVSGIKDNMRKNLSQISVNKERMSIIISSFDVLSSNITKSNFIQSTPIDNNMSVSTGRKIIF